MPHELYAFERFQHQPWPLVEKAMADRQRAYNSLVIFDATGVGKPLADYLTIPNSRLWKKTKTATPGYVFSPSTKTQLLVNLQYMIQKRLIRLPRIPQLIRELLDYRWDDATLPETDSVMALALACWAVASRPKVSVRYI